MHVHIDKDKEERNKDIRIIGFLVYGKICDLTHNTHRNQINQTNFKIHVCQEK